jgi:hypothetical protein
MPGSDARNPGRTGLSDDRLPIRARNLKVFATEEVAQARIDENDPESVAFQYEVIGAPA